ncbi:MULTISPECIES: hypothetical protein [unclassified Streptomyces]|uniref:hypothetical protein n=1 Tax=unclassified Streptomyces TaxID=2593676 RepID=UPI002E117F4E|nr:hypothetical protein OG457_12090 [Streptomyces sp. NBC_01207]WTA17786.1 hypothetical protein OG365_06780 [Streptomyces sp. NBC_00853]
MPIRIRGRAVVDAVGSAVSAASHAMAPQRRSVTRLRLTCLYGGVFMMAGTALLAIVHLLAVQAVSRGNDPVLELRSESAIVMAPAGCPEPSDSGPALCPTPSRQQPQDSLMASTALVLAALVPLSATAGYVTAGYALSPLRRITHHARRASRESS